MVFSKMENKPTCSIKNKKEVLEQVDQFIYLSNMATSDGKCDNEIKRRIGIAKTSHKRLERALTSKSVTLGTRLRILKCYVWSTLLYCCKLDNQQRYGITSTGSRNVVYSQNVEGFMVSENL